MESERADVCHNPSGMESAREAPDFVTHTASLPRKKEHITNTTTQGFSTQAHCTLVLLPHVLTVSLIHSFTHSFIHSSVSHTHSAKHKHCDTRVTAHTLRTQCLLKLVHHLPDLQPCVHSVRGSDQACWQSLAR